MSASLDAAAAENQKTGFGDDHSARRRRGIAPKNIATFNTHTEALEPMAGALWTSYDASFPAIWVEAMRKPSRAGGEPAKARPRKAVKPKGRSAPKVTRSRPSSVGGIDKKIALLTRERDDSLQQQTATSDVLQVISRSPGDLQPVFETILENAVRICDAKFGNIYRWDGNSLSLVATHNTPRAYAEARRRSPFRPNPNNIFGSMVATKTVVHILDAAKQRDRVTLNTLQRSNSVAYGRVLLSQC